MNKLRRTHTKALAPTALSSTIAAVWDPAANRRVRLMGVELRESSGTALNIAVTNGTAAASGTIGFIGISASGVVSLDFGDAGMLADMDAVLGFKTLANAGTVTGTLVGREERF